MDRRQRSNSRKTAAPSDAIPLESAHDPAIARPSLSASMGAMAENRELTQAMARLDALTDWERRPRKFMRVGLAPMLDLAARLGRPQRPSVRSMSAGPRARARSRR